MGCGAEIAQDTAKGLPVHLLRLVEGAAEDGDNEYNVWACGLCQPEQTTVEAAVFNNLGVI